MRTERGTAVAACAALAALLVGVAASAQTDEERELAAVRRAIAELEQRLERQTTERSAAAAALRELELAIASSRQAVERIEAETAEARRNVEAVAAERRAVEARVDAERAALAEQVRVTYINGRTERLKLLLSQENPADFGRMSVYYDYFNRARAERVRSVAAHVAELERLETEAARLAAELGALASDRSAELEALDRSRAERAALLAELDASIQAGGGELERLRDEERRLVELVTELGKVMAAFPVNSEEPFPRLKGRLAWPVAGRIETAFGQRRAAGVTSTGVLLAAEQGAPVRAVYHGRVVFADWLHGLGLLLVVDHGDGYMTLYGHNDALLKEPGDWVRPGEPIAQVGTTGGRSSPALYFEIRHDGEPVDPHAWIAN
ncbi:MAG TPA: peptidoglycan DD-metalloendopeptidase family protein [Gammaproteobacteria bacterium]